MPTVDPNKQLVKAPTGVESNTKIIAQFPNPHPYIIEPIAVIGHVYQGPNGAQWVGGHDLTDCIRAWFFPNPFDEEKGTAIVDDMGSDGWFKGEASWTCFDQNTTAASADEINNEYDIAWVGVWLPYTGW